MAKRKLNASFLYKKGDKFFFDLKSFSSFLIKKLNNPDVKIKMKEYRDYLQEFDYQIFYNKLNPDQVQDYHKDLTEKIMETFDIYKESEAFGGVDINYYPDKLTFTFHVKENITITNNK